MLFIEPAFTLNNILHFLPHADFAGIAPLEGGMNALDLFLFGKDLLRHRHRLLFGPCCGWVVVNGCGGGGEIFDDGSDVTFRGEAVAGGVFGPSGVFAD